MSFQNFCNDAEDIDGQVVDVNDSVVINFSNRSGKNFSVDPKDIVAFLKYLLSNHVQCVGVIENDPDFDSGKTYLNYKEKPYRALYNSLSGQIGLGSIVTLGASQTSALTGVITKFVCYLSGIEFIKIRLLLESTFPRSEGEIVHPPRASQMPNMIVGVLSLVI